MVGVDGLVCLKPTYKTEGGLIVAPNVVRCEYLAAADRRAVADTTRRAQDAQRPAG